MRRLIPLLVVLAPLALGAWSGSASAACTESSGPTCCTSGPACCDPPTPAQPPCCGTVCTIQDLTIASSPDPSKYGQKVTITGKLTGGASGATVTLWQRLAGQSSYQQVAQTTTDSSGDYTIVRAAGTVKMNTAWYVSAGTAVSPALAQDVSAQVKFTHWVSTGQHVTLHGHVSPTHKGERIELQQRVGKHWRTIAKAKLGRRSNFTVHHHFAHSGKVVLRAVFAGDASNARSVSGSLKLRLS